MIGGRLELTKTPQPEISFVRRIHYFLRTHLITYDSLVRVYLYSKNSVFKFLRKLVNRTSNWFRDKDNENGLELTFAIFDEIRALCKTKDAELVIVSIATHNQALNFDSTKPSPLAKFCRSRGIPFLDLADPFHDYLQEHASESLQLPADRHWNALAHRLAAEAINSYLKSENLIPAHILN